MNRSLSIVREILLGRPVADSDAARYNAALASETPELEAAILQGFSDAQWEAVRAFCKRHGFLWHRDDVAAPVSILPDVLWAVEGRA